MNRWRDKKDVVYVYNRIFFSHKKNEIMPFAATWVEIILTEVSQRKTNIWYHLHVESKKKKNKVNELIYKTEIDSQKTTLWLPRGTVKKGDKLGVWD